jgi:hypothetical protein
VKVVKVVKVANIFPKVAKVLDFAKVAKQKQARNTQAVLPDPIQYLIVI